MIMAFYLKKTKLKGRTYLSIDESFYNHDKKGTAHKCYKSLGSVETLLSQGIENPIEYYQKEVDELNKQRKDEGTPKISEISPITYAGYFPLNSIMEKLGVSKYIKAFNLVNDFKFDLFQVLSLLVYARCVNPCSKLRTYKEVLPCLYHDFDFSYEQLMNGLGFLGNNYEKIIEVFTTQTKQKFGIDASKSFFDCTNFYFEIDREDDFRRNGPSKENRKDPIVGLGLLLDSNLIPIGMKLYPGNCSEKPVFRDVISSLKQTGNIVGKTICVADKGLNCAENIASSKKNGDGYLFSKSVKQLPETEKEWVLLDNDYKDVRDKNGKLLYKYKSCIDKFPYKVEYNGKKISVELTEKRLVTYNPSLAAKKKYEIAKMVNKAMALTMSGAKKSEFGEAGKYFSFTDKNGEKAGISLNKKAIEKDLALAGYNLIITSETQMSEKDIYDTYHNLWRIEESFKIMKSDLDARPVFEQKENTIKGHFLICYIAVLLKRILQFKLLKNKYSSEEITKLIKDFKILKCDNKYQNLTSDTDFIKAFAAFTNLPLRNAFLTSSQVKSVFNWSIK